MGTASRDERDTPEAVQRTITDEEGRRWTGTVSSGRQREEVAEVLFVCEDQPSAEKRIARLDVDSGKADRAWKRMEDDEVREVFRSARRA